MSVVLGMMPTKGIPLPMISYGGSSLLSTLALPGNADERERACGMSMKLQRRDAETREAQRNVSVLCDLCVSALALNGSGLMKERIF